ncbi:RDD family protein [Desmospora activa]|uniref:RDD family protein n=1 Tax=Desmospora activa DSM 45169 TaxID=1121389 RepID=A0A2T4Z7L4_9BACL|nr:RDD family protein [Desmospora activa]PTM57869.1 RDD family protein [Desmospora activa DSM 45169]
MKPNLTESYESYQSTRYASLKLRMYAFLLDYLIIVAYGILLGLVSSLLQPVLTPLFTTSPLSAEITGFFLITLPVTLYFAICESSNWQGTWGKRKMGIQVTDQNGDRPRLGRSLLRSVVKFTPWEMAHFVIWRLALPPEYFVHPSSYPLPFLYTVMSFVYIAVSLYMLTPLLSRSKRSIYDWIAGTAVVVK